MPPGKRLLTAGALFVALERGETEKVRMLLQAKPQLIRAADELGWTPLHWAAYDGQYQIARWLVEKGALIDAICQEGWAPLHLAIQEGSRVVTEFLVKAGPTSIC